MLFKPGGVHIYTTNKIEGGKPNLVPWEPNLVITALDADKRNRTCIYPNPSNDIFRMDGIANGTYRFQLFDLKGRILRDNSIDAAGQFETALTGLGQGIYQAGLSGDNSSYFFQSY